MSDINDAEYVKQQYSDDEKLSTRINLYTKYCMNKQEFIPWLFEKYCFFSNNSILELGCGNGRQWEGSIDSLPLGSKLVLSDFSDGMVNTVKDKFSSFDNVTFQKVDIRDIPFDNESYDIVIANHMLYHISDLDKALSEVKRVLKSGGNFYSTTNGNGGIRQFLYDALKRFEPETTAFSQIAPFNLQNGEEILYRYFSAVKIYNYENALAITETQDLMDFIKSVISKGSYPDEKFISLYNYFESIRSRDGAINIPLEAGLFVSAK